MGHSVDVYSHHQNLKDGHLRTLREVQHLAVFKAFEDVVNCQQESTKRVKVIDFMPLIKENNKQLACNF